MESEKQVFDSPTLDDIHRILNALMKSDDPKLQKLMKDAFSDKKIVTGGRAQQQTANKPIGHGTEIHEI